MVKVPASLAICIALLFGVGCGFAQAQAPKPNILIILTDDLGRGDYSAFGAPDIHTLNIVRLCHEGMKVAGVTPPGQIDGLSFLPALTGKDESTPKRDLYFIRRERGIEYGGKTIDAYRRDDWKLLQDNPSAPLEPYDLHTDPMESTNLAMKHHQILDQLLKAMMKQIQLGGQVLWQAPDSKPDSNRGPATNQRNSESSKIHIEKGK